MRRIPIENQNLTKMKMEFSVQDLERREKELRQFIFRSKTKHSSRQSL